MTDSTTGVTGHQDIADGGSSHNSERLHIAGAQDERRHVVVVRVTKTYGGGVGAAPTVDVQPLIDQVDGLGQPTSHAPIFGLPVSRVHSGNGAIISDPMPGDDYILSIPDRDISKYLASGQQSSPDSKRRSSMSDGILHHAVRSPTPTQYVQFRSDGVTIADQYGNIIETHSDKVCIIPKQGNTIYLGGDGINGSYDYLQTVSGQPSINTKTRTS